VADAVAVDAATSGFVAACDAALDEARKLKALYEAAGDRRASLVDRATDLIAGRRADALEGTLHRPSSGVALGFSRFIGDVDWGPEGKALLDAAYAAERYWKQEM
jgi:hypothetical protein